MFSIQFNVERSIVINESVETVFNKVSDFNTWDIWSPWICQEPECPVKISGKPGEKGHTQAWDGNRIGAGHITLVDIIADRSLNYDLFFIRPWKSQ